MFLQQLGEDQIRVVTSASDLTAASVCEFAFLCRVDARLGRDIDIPADDNAMLARAAQLGDAHEARVLAQYVERFGQFAAGGAAGASAGAGAGGGAGGVAQIPRADSRDGEALRAAEAQTLAALHGGADIVFQATFFDAAQQSETASDPAIAFVGYADFLARRNDGSYEVQDTKLARTAKVTALMQLAAYADQLERLRVPVSPEVVLILGSGAHSRHRLRDIAPVFRARRERLHTLLLERVRAVGLDGERRSADAIGWGAPGIVACGRCEVCEAEVQRTRDPLLIAGIRRTQRDALVAAGFDTIEKVARLQRPPGVLHDDDSLGTEPGRPGDLRLDVLERLAMQASLQIASRADEAPPFQVVDPLALGSIPQPNAGDIFFDFEGDPMYRESGFNETARWGIDYLFGTIDIHEQFRPFWAHDLAAEKRALQEFLAFVAERRLQYPAMRIYHYAPYERTHLLSIAARHGIGEAEVDQLLREHVLVDLYPIVRKALRVGSRSYSIKKLEPLYMGKELRDEDGVLDGAQSIVEYGEAREQLASADPAERELGQHRLDAIAEYNRYDCVSTLRLRDWLLRIAAEHDVQPHRPVSAQPDGVRFELNTIATTLAWLATMAEDVQDRKAAALAGSAIDYYQREQKSFWWEHYARLIDPIEDWADTRDVLVVDETLSGALQDWFLPTRARVERRHLRLRGALAPGSSLKVGSDAYLLYEYPAPFPTVGAQPGARGAKLVKIIDRHVPDRNGDGVTVEETIPRDLDQYTVFPVALVPGPPPQPGRQRGAIQEWGERLADSLSRGKPLQDPVYEIMRRLPPRLEGGADLVDPKSDLALQTADGDENSRMIGAVIASLRKFQSSALAVQGPPGTGKTFLAARVIRTLVERDGWHIGVVAQSHKVVDNLLDGIVAAGLDPAQVGKVPQSGEVPQSGKVPQSGLVPQADTLPVDSVPDYTVLGKDGHAAFLREHRKAGKGAVIGGTAWDFANETRVARKSLDLLVIDEAGQFSLAPTIAASVAAKRLLLLGDPQQLPQVSQGSHPEPINTSALGWLLGEDETIPAGSGYFLPETRRMHPALAEVISELAYEKRLRSHASAAERKVTGAGPAGLNWHPVAHTGNATSSPEEAAVVARIATDNLRSGMLQEPGEMPRPLTQADLIVVAAYNAQVECVTETLAAAGLGEIRVGTVDKFQGQEAVIAIVTLAASNAETVPRGLDFLLMRNRLNVAISRAQWAAHLVSSDALGDTLPTSSEGVAALSGYLRLIERAVRVAP